MIFLDFSKTGVDSFWFMILQTDDQGYVGGFCGCTAIEEAYSFVSAITCLSIFIFGLSIEMFVKVWVLAHKYYVMLMTKEIPLNSAFAVRPKSESSGLEVEAKLDFQYQYSYPQCTNINQQGIFLQVDYRGLF